MNRKYDVGKRILWAENNYQEIINLLYDSLSTDISSYAKLTSELLEHLNSVYDYSIKDLVDKTGIIIERNYYFPFRVITNNNALIQLPANTIIYLNNLANMFSTNEFIPDTIIEYNVINKMRKLVNAGKHNKISVSMKTFDNGDIKYTSTTNTVVILEAEKLENSGFKFNPHHKREGKVNNLLFDDDEILNESDRIVTSFCMKCIGGTKYIMKILYDYIENYSI